MNEEEAIRQIENIDRAIQNLSYQRNQLIQALNNARARQQPAIPPRRPTIYQGVVQLGRGKKKKFMRVNYA